MKLLTLLLTCLLVQTSYAQRADKFYHYNPEWKPTDLKKAAYTVRIRQTSDTSFVKTTYNNLGPRISQERFKDADCKTLHGWCAYYRPNGYIDSAGEYAKNIQTGSWFFYNDDARPFKRKDYENGRFIKDTLYTVLPMDSVLKDTAAVPGAIESSFKGGREGWAKYLQANFRYPVQAQKANVQGVVILQFVIDQKGKVQDPEVDKSVEYSLDEESLRIIQHSPAWLPASVDGKVLKSWKLQPVIFMLDGK